MKKILTTLILCVVVAAPAKAQPTLHIDQQTMDKMNTSLVMAAAQLALIAFSALRCEIEQNCDYDDTFELTVVRDQLKAEIQARNKPRPQWELVTILQHAEDGTTFYFKKAKEANLLSPDEPDTLTFGPFPCQNMEPQGLTHNWRGWTLYAVCEPCYFAGNLIGGQIMYQPAADVRLAANDN